MSKDEWFFLFFMYFMIIFISLLLLYPKTHFMRFVSIVLPAQLVIRHIYYLLFDP